MILVRLLMESEVDTNLIWIRPLTWFEALHAHTSFLRLNASKCLLILSKFPKIITQTIYSHNHECMELLRN